MECPALANESGYYVCNACDFTTTHKGHYRKHIKSGKHVTKEPTNHTTANSSIPVTMSDVMSILLKQQENTQVQLLKQQENTQVQIGMIMKHQETTQQQNTELLKALFAERSAVLHQPSAPMSTTTANTQNNITLEHITNNTTNNNNKKFSLNVFLNEECKNAVDVSEFITNAMITMEDLEYIGEVGYTEGMTKILSKAFKEKSVTERPMHCTDIKRETIYVRKNDAWEKDTDQEETKRLIRKIAHKNYKVLEKWLEYHPQYSVHDTPDYESWYSISRSICNTDPAALKKLVKHLALTTAVEKEP
jgi:hypothetical protein